MVQSQQTDSNAASQASPNWRDRLALLADPDFRRVWLVGAIYGTTRWLETLAIAVFVFDLTGSPFMVALMLVARMLPMILFGSINGAIAEQFNRRTLLSCALAFVSTLSGVLALLAYNGQIELWHVAIGAFCGGAIWSADYPVRRTLLGELAGMQKIGAAMSLDSATNNATRMMGPLLGGLVYEFIGLPGTYVVSFVMFGLAALLAITLRFNPPPILARGGSLLTNIIEGLTYIRGQRTVMAVLAITVALNFFAFPFASMVPVIGGEVMQLSAFPIGVLMSAEGLGGFVGALGIALFARQPYYAKIYTYGSFLFLLAILAFSLVGSFALSLPVLLIGGLGVAGFSTMQSTIMFTTAAPEVRSRVLGVLAVCIGTGPLGLLHIGMLADWLGATVAVSIIAVEGLVAMIAIWLFWPEMR